MRILIILMLIAGVAACSDGETPFVSGDGVRPAAMPGEWDTLPIAILVNENNPDSVAVGEYYAAARCLPESHVIRVDIDESKRVMPVERFRQLRAGVERQLPGDIRFLALAWAEPTRVGCMSMATAFAAGFDEKWCASGCRMTATSDYYASATRNPVSRHGLRPTMHLATADIAETLALIDRGVAADGLMPESATAWLVSTTDPARNVRAVGYPSIVAELGDIVRVERLTADALEYRDDVMFYFVGTKRVAGLGSNRYLPGAVGDNVTSSGGNLRNREQTTVLEWISAGVTGSYGTVVEPCNFPAKFPDPKVLMERYLAGETLVEAYWKSVAAPGQGMFIGEPMARPFDPDAAHCTAGKPAV